jgi:hypothetical protein
MNTGHCLLFQHGIPLRLDEEGMIGSSQIKPRKTL